MKKTVNRLKFFSLIIGVLVLLLAFVYTELLIFGYFNPVRMGLKITLSIVAIFASWGAANFTVEMVRFPEKFGGLVNVPGWCTTFLVLLIMVSIAEFVVFSLEGIVHLITLILN